jgi:hypothetical protein
MKKRMNTLIAIVFALCWISVAPAQSTLNIDLADDNGSTKLSLYWTGDIVNGGVTFTDLQFPILWHGFGGTFTNFFNNGSGNYTFSQFGSMQNVTSGSSVAVGSAVFSLSGGAQLYFYFTNSQSLIINSGNVVDYIPGTDSATISLPFSYLNAGTYYQQETIPSFSFNLVLNVESVPEPSSLALVGLCALGFCSRGTGRYRWRGWISGDRDSNNVV